MACRPYDDHSGRLSATRPADPLYGADGYRHRWLVLVVVMVADVMDLLDASVANLAGPSIRADLGSSSTTLQWVLAAYTLTLAVGLLTSARLGDVVGRTFFTAMTGFMLTINLFMQYGLRWTPLHTGRAMAPWALGPGHRWVGVGAGLRGDRHRQRVGVRAAVRHRPCRARRPRGRHRLLRGQLRGGVPAARSAREGAPMA